MVTGEEYLERLRRQRDNVYMDLECFEKAFSRFDLGSDAVLNFNEDVL